VISGLPGVRTAQIAHCRVDDLVRPCYAQWVSAGRKPLALQAVEVMAPHAICTCRVHQALRNMRSVLVHGVRDARNGDESLYIALDSAPFANDWRADRFASLAHLLISQLDIAMRKLAAFPLERPTEPQERAGAWLDLSSREQEILDWLCRGKTNIGIAAALDISPFTVKNHIKRIFRKLSVGNRVQAAAKYHQSLRESIALSDG
jgi:transcriptional regulator EpsA